MQHGQGSSRRSPSLLSLAAAQREPPPLDFGPLCSEPVEGTNTQPPQERRPTHHTPRGVRVSSLLTCAPSVLRASSYRPDILGTASPKVSPGQSAPLTLQMCPAPPHSSHMPRVTPPCPTVPRTPPISPRPRPLVKAWWAGSDSPSPRRHARPAETIDHDESFRIRMSFESKDIEQCGIENATF